jgi:hypothetical protein
MIGYQSKKQKRHADEITLDHLIELRSENERLRKALHTIGYGPPHEGEPISLLNQFVDLARAALKEKE